MSLLTTALSSGWPRPAAGSTGSGSRPAASRRPARRCPPLATKEIPEVFAYDYQTVERSLGAAYPLLTPDYRAGVREERQQEDHPRGHASVRWSCRRASSAWESWRPNVNSASVMVYMNRTVTDKIPAAALRRQPVAGGLPADRRQVADQLHHADLAGGSQSAAMPDARCSPTGNARPGWAAVPGMASENGVFVIAGCKAADVAVNAGVRAGKRHVVERDRYPSRPRCVPSGHATPSGLVDLGKSTDRWTVGPGQRSSPSSPSG